MSHPSVEGSIPPVTITFLLAALPRSYASQINPWIFTTKQTSGPPPSAIAVNAVEKAPAGSRPGLATAHQVRVPPPPPCSAEPPRSRPRAPAAQRPGLQPSSSPPNPPQPTPQSAAVFKSSWLEKARGAEVGPVLETVQVVQVVFKLALQAEYGEGLRLIGGHEAMGAWSLQRSVPLRWTPGDVWRSPALELPVDGVFVYKYVRCADGDAQRPLSWQQGNNQVLTLTAADAPLLEVADTWRGDPGSASTSAPDGSRRMQLEERLTVRVRDTDRALREARSQITALSEELRHARLQAKALREEARLGANVRLALKDQLRAEKKRSGLLEAQVESWKARLELPSGADSPEK